MSEPVAQPSLEEIRAARERIRGFAPPTPLIKLDLPEAPGEIYLKLENLQPIGAFKLRPAAALLSQPGLTLSETGVFCASSGNMAIGFAYIAKRLGLPMTAVVPPEAPQAKLALLAELGAALEPVSQETWWETIQTGALAGMEQTYIDGVKNTLAIAGDATIGLEILEALPDVDTIVAPFGGGGLVSGIASAVKAHKPDTRLVGGESEAAAPLAAALAAGAPVEVPASPSFITGMGVSRVLEPMWPLLESLIDRAETARLAEVAEAIRVLALRGRVVAEGAGAVPLAIARAGKAGGGKIVCVVSGGNIAPEDLTAILNGGVPERS